MEDPEFSHLELHYLYIAGQYDRETYAEMSAVVAKRYIEGTTPSMRDLAIGDYYRRVSTGNGSHSVITEIKRPGSREVEWFEEYTSRDARILMGRPIENYILTGSFF